MRNSEDPDMTAHKRAVLSWFTFFCRGIDENISCNYTCLAVQGAPIAQ